MKKVMYFLLLYPSIAIAGENEIVNALKTIDWKNINLFLSIIVAVFVILSGLYGFLKFIDHRINKKLNDANFVKSIARLLRPYMIFNHHNELLVDRGAMAFIEEFEVENKMKSDHELPQRIKIQFKKHHSIAPLIIELSNEMCTIKERRGEKFTWYYDIEYSGWTETNERRFHLEIIT